MTAPRPSRWLHHRAARHVGRGAHHVLRWIGAFAAVLILAALCGIWRLMQGPIELDWLAPYVEAAIRQTGVGLKVELSGVRFGIDRTTHRLDLKAEDVRLWLPSGEPLAHFPEMATSFGLGDLLHGQLGAAAVVVERPVLHLVRTAGGAFSAQIGGEQTATELGPQMLEQLAGPPERDAPLGMLHRISIRGATLLVDDRPSGRTWRADRVDIAIDRSSKGARGDVSFAVPIGNSKPELHASYRYLADRQLLDLTLSIEGIEPAAIPPLVPELVQLRHVEAPISGTLETRIDLKQGRAQGSRLDLTLGKGRLYSDWLPIRSVVVDRGDFHATYAPESDEVRVENFSLDLDGGTRVDITGVLGGVTPELAAAPIGVHPPGHVTGTFTTTLSNVPVARLGELWPIGLNRGARDWVTKNVHDGMLDSLSSHIAIDLDPAAHTASLLNADGNLQYHGLTIDYFDGLPPVRKVDGTAVFAGHQLTFTPTAGTLKGLKLTGGSLQLTELGTPTEWLTIDASLAGPLRDALEVIDSKPLHYAHAIGLDPEQLTGRTETQLHFKLPLLAHLSLAAVDYAAKATITGANVREIALGHGFSDGNLSLDLDRAGARLKGDVRFADVPTKLDADITFHPKSGPHATFRVGMTLDDAAQQRLGFDIAPDRISGPIAVVATYAAFAANRGEATALLDLRDATLAIPEAGWKKPPGQPGTAKIVLDLDDEMVNRIREIQVTAPGLDGRMAASFGADHHHVDAVEIRRLAVAESDFAGTVTPRAGGGWHADIRATRVDMRHLLKDAANGLPSVSSPPLAVTARVDRLVFGPHREARQVSAELLRTGGVWQSGRIAGHYADGHQLALQFGDGDGHRLTFQTDDLGDCLKLLDVADNVVGGQLQLDGEMSQAVGQRVMHAHIDGRNYTITRAPGLARILALPSLTGLASTLSGSGLPFMTLRGDIAYANGTVTLQRLLAFGESLGVTAKGSIDTDRDQLQLEGTVAPAYALNSLIGNVPIIGPLLGGGSQGLFAANYRLSGPSDNPQVSVNPLSALAPGFLRQLFEPFSSFAPPPQPGPQAQQRTMQ